ncbi:MAG: hypothetical protein ABW101_18255 [Candidatus Thiodiazotropha sp.]
MNLTTRPISKILFSIGATLAIAACVPVEDDSDSASEKEAREILQANNWQSSDCMRDNNGTYRKGLYRFGDDGQLRLGYQAYQDSSCSTRANDQHSPDSIQAGYEMQGEETLFDGSDGYAIDLDILGNSINSYFNLRDSDTLCFADNVTFEANGLSAEINNSASYIDYDHCLSIYSSNNDPNPNPNPVTNANLQGIWVLGTQCRVNNTGDHFYWIMQFRDDGHVFQAYAFFDNANCSGTTTSTTLAELDPVLTYTDLGEATLSDGRQGRQMRLSQGANNFEGYYIIENQNELCVSHSFTLTGSGLTSTDIDYNNCFTRYQE